MDSAVELIEQDSLPFILIQSGFHPPRSGENWDRILSEDEIPHAMESLRRSKYVAVDFETRGGDYSDNLDIVGLGLAWNDGSCYIDWTECPTHLRNLIIRTLNSHSGLIAHNVYFDGGVYLRHFEQHAQWHACTYSLYAMIANESPERKWGLKQIQTEVLGWESSNETELDRWLVMGGYYIGNRRILNTPEYLEAEFNSGGLRPNRGEMWRAPRDILGKYCILDAEACYLLYTEVLDPLLNKFESLRTHFHENVMHLIRVLIDQKMAGIPVDRAGLEIRREEVQAQIDSLTQQFLRHEEVASHIQEMETAMREPLRSRQPQQFRKDGVTVSKNWLKWQERWQSACAGELPDYKFNLQSQPQLRELLYARLGYEVRMRTESGEASTGIKALRPMGDIGLILTQRMWCVKELSYVEKYIELLATRDTIHPSFRAPGTITGRLSSKEPNMQQIPKTAAMLSLFNARPGCVWVDLDFSALEPVVATEFSQDPNMLRIYGDDAPKNDIYLYVGAHIPGMAEKIRATGYDPENPTPASLARAKKECKHERGICKTVTLACQYGAGVNKVLQTLENDDVYLDWEEVEKIHSGYWHLFDGVRQFGRSLLFEWRRNGGYILNGMGRPMCVPEAYNKDLLNRFIQSTGHDILVRYVRILCDELTERGIAWSPVIIDFHDASTVEVPEEQAEQTVAVFNWAMDELNRELGGSIKLKGVPVVGRDLADCKEPEE